MTNSCAPAPTNKKEYITDIGKILVDEHGKKKYYKPEEIEKAHKESKWYHGLDFSCWAMCTFSSHSDFDHHHQNTGEICDYAEMKTEMLSGLSLPTSTDWFDIPNIDIDASWLDFGDIFEGVLEGIGEFVAGIFDGI
jgi:hypothetical protein